MALQILIDDPDLDVSGGARNIWAANVKKYLPCCALWRRDLKGLKQKLQEVHCQYASLQQEDPLLNESKLRQQVHKCCWRVPNSCKPEVDDSEYFIE